MKKLIIAMLALAAIAPLSAQQLPNNGFEEPWVDCRPWTSANNTTVQGTTPKDWTASNVYAGSGLLASGNQTVAENVAGYNNSSSAIKVGSKSFTVPIYGKKIVPGYFTLGTTWSTSTANQNNDGGTFRGITFSSMPDAIEFQYMAEGGTSNAEPTVVAYLWNGTFIQKNVPGNIALSKYTLEKVDMIDRDLCVLGRSLDGHQGDKTLSEKGTLIASAISRPEIFSEWTKGKVSLEYKEGVSAKAEKFNIIFSAGDYFSTTPTEGCTMTVDDVKLLYYSRLETLTANGTEVTLEKDKYKYDLSESVYMPKSADKISYTLLGQSPAKTVDVALDAEKNTATITVKNTNEGATDVDGESEHVYTIKFKAPRVFTGIEYPGHITTLTWNVDGSGHTSLIEEPVKASVWMTKKGLKRIVDVLLPDFTLPGIGTIGDILVENVTRTYNNNNGNPIYDYIGHVDDLSLAEGGIHAEVDLKGTSDVYGNVSFKIDVKWISNYEELHPQAIVAREPVEPVYIPIKVEFNGTTLTPEVPTGINDVTVDGADAPVEYFDLQGIRVSNPQAGQMVIRRQGTNVEKILVK